MMETREAKAMSLVMAPDQRQARRSARLELVRQVKLGTTASEARRRCSVPMHRTTVYRLLKRVECEGEQVFAEKRHGHPVKLRGEVLTCVLDYCQNHASAASREVQCLVAERFGITVSISQLNRVRASHGLSRKAPQREKNLGWQACLEQDLLQRRQVGCGIFTETQLFAPCLAPKGELLPHTVPRLQINEGQSSW
jgi:transposase